MSYTMKNGRHADTEEVVLNPSAALISVDEYTAARELGDRSTLRLTLAVTAVSTDDTLDVVIETSDDGVTWYTAGSFTQATAATTERKIFMVSRFVRALFNVGGASAVSIGCTLRGEAV